MEDKIVKQQQLKAKLQMMILTMKSNRRERIGRYGLWALTCKTLLEGVFNLDDYSILQKGGRLLCFKIVHEQKCEGQYDCSCEETVADPLITLYYFSDLFTKMISVSHFQIYFSQESKPTVLSDIIDGLVVSSIHLELFNKGEGVFEYLRHNQEHANAEDKEDEKEKSPDFQRMLTEFNSLICEYVRLAFTDPTSLPPFLLDVDEGPTMRLSELDAWLKSE
jgi:hypothetical protein